MNKLPVILFIFATLLSAFSEDQFNVILSHYRYEILAKDNPQDKFEIALSHIPKSEHYRLFIDMDRLASPKPEEKSVASHLIFDVKEPGYFASMRDALKKLPEYLFRPVDLGLALLLHDLAIAQIATMEKGKLSSDFHYTHEKNEDAIDEMFHSGLFCEARRYFEAIGKTKLYGKTEDLINELEGLLELRHFISYAPEGWPLVVKSTGLENLELKLKPFTDHYYQSVRSAPNMNTVLMAIADLIRVLEVGHYLPDGNTRTNVFLIMQKLLIENGLPPAILDDPSAFVGGKTLEQMFRALKKGLHNYLVLNESRSNSIILQKQNIDPWLLGPSIYRPFHEVFSPPLQHFSALPTWKKALYLNEQQVLKNLFVDATNETREQGANVFLWSMKFGNIELSLSLLAYVRNWNMGYDWWKKVLHEAMRICDTEMAGFKDDQKACLRLVDAILGAGITWSSWDKNYLNEWAQDNYEHDEIRKELLEQYGLLEDFDDLDLD